MIQFSSNLDLLEAALGGVEAGEHAVNGMESSSQWLSHVEVERVDPS